MIKQNIFNLLIRVKIVLYCFAASVLLYELIIDLLNYAKLLLQVILALLSPRTQLGPSLGGYSLSLAMLFYLCSITIIQSNSIEVHLPFVINGTYEMDQFNFLFNLQDRLKSPLHTNDMVVWVEPFLNK